MFGFRLTLCNRFRAAWRVVVSGTREANGFIEVGLVFSWQTLFAVRHQTLDLFVGVVWVFRKFDACYGAWGTFLNAIRGILTGKATGGEMVRTFQALQLSSVISEGSQWAREAFV